MDKRTGSGNLIVNEQFRDGNDGSPQSPTHDEWGVVSDGEEVSAIQMSLVVCVFASGVVCTLRKSVSLIT